MGSPDLSRRLVKQPFVATVNEEFLNHVKFNGDDSAGALKSIAHSNNLFVYSNLAYKDNEDQARYVKQASKTPFTKWSGRITELLRLCGKVQDRFVNAELQYSKDGLVLLSEAQAKRIAQEIIMIIEETSSSLDHMKVKELLATYVNSTYDAWYINSTEVRNIVE